MRRNQSGSASTRRSQRPRCQEWSRSTKTAPSAARTWNGARRRSVDRGDRPDVAAVGVGVALDVPAAAALGLEQLGDVEAAPRALLQGGDRGVEAGAGGGADARVLAADQLAGLGRPGQQLAVEQQPAGVELVPEPGRLGGAADVGERGLGLSAVVEEGTAGAGVDRAGLAGLDPEALARRGLVAAGDDDRPRAHVLLLADHPADTGAAELGERLVGVLEQVGPLRGRRRRHRRRQVDQPARVDREAAHHLQRRGRVLLADADGARQPGLDDPLAGDVGDVEEEGRALAVGGGGCGRRVAVPLGPGASLAASRPARSRSAPPRPRPARARASAARSGGRRRRSRCRCRSCRSPSAAPRPGCGRRRPRPRRGTRRPSRRGPAAPAGRSRRSFRRRGRSRGPGPRSAPGSPPSGRRGRRPACRRRAPRG